MSNILINTGDNILIPLQYPLENVKSILNYDESIVGEGLPSNLTREFRYTTDLLNWSEWAILTNPSLQALSLDYRQDFDIQFRYTKTNSIGQIMVNWAVPVTQLEVVADVLEGSIFSILEETERNISKLWSRNVLQKVYETGTIPKYIERSDGLGDRDYVDFWRAVTDFLGLFVSLSRRFESLEHIDIVRKLLDSKRLYYKRDDTLLALTNLVTSAAVIFRERGSSYNELERLFGNRNVCGEIFLFSDCVPGTVGIFLNRNSILERYLHHQVELEFISLQKTPGYFINTTFLNESTVGAFSSSTITGPKIQVDSRIDHEVIMLVKGVGSVTVDIAGYDSSDVEYDLTYLHPSVVSGPPLPNVSFPKSDQWYLVRLTIYGSASFATMSQPDILKGSNVKMPTEVCKLVITVTFTGNLEIKDFLFKIAHTQYSKSFLQSSQLIDAWYTDKSAKDDPIGLAHHYLLNYSKTILINTGTRDNSENICPCDIPIDCESVSKCTITIDGLLFLLHKKVGNLLECTLEVGDVVVGSIPTGFLRASYLGGDETDFTNNLVWDNWGGMIIE